MYRENLVPNVTKSPCRAKGTTVMMYRIWRNISRSSSTLFLILFWGGRLMLRMLLSELWIQKRAGHAGGVNAHGQLRGRHGKENALSCIAFFICSCHIASAKLLASCAVTSWALIRICDLYSSKFIFWNSWCMFGGCDLYFRATYTPPNTVLNRDSRYIMSSTVTPPATAHAQNT